MDAATEASDKALEAGAKGIDAARSLGAETLDRASMVKSKLSNGIAERASLRLRGDEDERDEEG